MAAQLENGMLDLLGIQYRLENGFQVKGIKLAPLAYVMRVEEPESNSLGKVVFSKAYALTEKGQKVWLFSEQDLVRTGIFDDTWICRIDGSRQIICWREGTDEMLPVPEDLWKNKLEEK